MSNLALHPFGIDGIRRPAAEHYFRAMKFKNPQIQTSICWTPSLKQAVDEGRNQLGIILMDVQEKLREIETVE